MALFQRIYTQTRPQNRVCLCWISAVIALFSSVGLTTTASAFEFQCEAFDEQRLVRVEIPGQNSLCEVTVTNPKDAVRKVEWYAQNDTLYCSARAYELREKYEKKWRYTCSELPDTDGIDTLSPTQRRVLDKRLKLHIENGKTAIPPYRIKAIRAAASTQLDEQPGKIALQFFTDKGDFTEVVDDQVKTWTITNTLELLSGFVTSDVPVESALLQSISDAGALEVLTQLNDTDNVVCHGTQLLKPLPGKDAAKAGSPHRFSCSRAYPQIRTEIPTMPPVSDITPQ